MDTTNTLVASKYEFCIKHDEFCESPRNGFNLGTLCLNHRRYALPWEFDGVSQKNPRVCFQARDWDGRFIPDWKDCRSWDEVALAVRQKLQADGDDFALVIPVYMLDHSGCFFSVPRVPFFRFDPFSHLYMGWDSGPVGFIFISRKKVLAEYGWKRLDNERRLKLWNALKAEVEEYNAWSNGDCYNYEVRDEEGNEVDSCPGFIGRDVAEQAVKENWPTAEEVDEWDE